MKSANYTLADVVKTVRMCICQGHMYSARDLADWCDKIEAADKEISAENVKLKTALWQIKNRSIEVDTMIGESDAYDCEVVYRYALDDIDKIASAALGQEVSHCVQTQES